MAALGEVPFGLYYGSVDSTPLFVLLAGLYVERTGDEETLRELWPAIEAALAWIDGPGDPDGDGFVEYFRQTDQGLANQGWKDSLRCDLPCRRPHWPKGPIALAEVQGYVFAAKQLAARCAQRLGHAERAAKLEAEAARLAERFEAAFWCPELETYALALDGDKQPCRVRTSNAGQVLFTGIARPERAALVADGLLSPRFFSGWGIRTVAQRRSALQSDVLSQRLDLAARQRADRARLRALRLEARGRAGVQGPVRGRDLHGPAAPAGAVLRLPAQRRRGPTLYPVACAPQAWASATPFSLIEASLGPGVRSRNERNPPAQPAAAVVPRRGDPAQSAARRIHAST